MHKFMNKLFSSRRQYTEIVLASLLLVTALGEAEAKQSENNRELKISTTQHSVSPTKAFSKDGITIFKGKLPTKDGVYLYSQAPKPNQIGKEYMVFELRQGKVIGAFYLPQSEFNCFQGSLESGSLALTIANSPDSTTYSDQIGDRNSLQVATASHSSQIGDEYQQIESPYAVALQNYYQLSSVSDNDRRILATCKNSYQQ